MTEIELEKKIKQDLSTYEIKSTSEEILAKHNSKASENKKRLWIFAPILGGVTIAAAMAMIIPSLMSKNPISINGNTKALLDDSSTVSSLVLQTYALRNIQDNSGTSLKGLNEVIEDTDIVDRLNNALDSYNDFDSHHDGLAYSYKQEEKVIMDKTYSYTLSTSYGSLYFSSDITKKTSYKEEDCAIEINEVYYLGNVHLVNNKQKTITSLSYVDNDETISIRRKDEEDGFKMEYKVIEGNKVKYTYDMDLEIDDEDVLNYSYGYHNKENNEHYQIDFRHDPDLVMDYLDKKEDISYTDIHVSEEDGIRIFTK